MLVELHEISEEKEQKMTDKKIEIEIDDQVFQTRTRIGILIVCAPTGIHYTPQVGGIVCEHPSIEGFTIPIDIKDTDPESICHFNNALKELGDCDWGCHPRLKGKEQLNDEMNYIYRDWRHREDYALEIHKFIDNNINGKIHDNISFYFDSDRLDELMEGWWPVSIKFTAGIWNWDKNYEELIKKQVKGYLHFGNCI